MFLLSKWEEFGKLSVLCQFKPDKVNCFFFLKNESFKCRSFTTKFLPGFGVT